MPLLCYLSRCFSYIQGLPGPPGPVGPTVRPISIFLFFRFALQKFHILFSTSIFSFLAYELGIVNIFYLSKPIAEYISMLFFDYTLMYHYFSLSLIDIHSKCILICIRIINIINSSHFLRDHPER